MLHDTHSFGVARGEEANVPSKMSCILLGAFAGRVCFLPASHPNAGGVTKPGTRPQVTTGPQTRTGFISMLCRGLIPQQVRCDVLILAGQHVSAKPRGLCGTSCAVSPWVGGAGDASPGGPGLHESLQI